MKTAIVASTIWAPRAASVAPPAGPSVTPFGVTTGDLSGATDVVMSDPLPCDLFVYRGDSGRFRVVVTDASTGVPLDISDATWDCDIRSGYDSETVLVSLNVNRVNNSTIEVILDPAMSAALVDKSVWDLEMTLGTEVQTLLAGTVHVHKDVSRQ